MATAIRRAEDLVGAADATALIKYRYYGTATPISLIKYRHYGGRALPCRIGGT
ncbi:hypothetical protein [Hamadaea tsunoensis]|uniref:hypothetical protein n=1 Tax=Hamadaea tsunoensis TaxID=53368 RepID=UPI0003F55AEB|nr:hypothetical protein [Hamadaea tsunoensis]